MLLQKQEDYSVRNNVSRKELITLANELAGLGNIIEKEARDASRDVADLVAGVEGMLEFMARSHEVGDKDDD